MNEFLLDLIRHYMGADDLRKQGTQKNGVNELINDILGK